jgi:hypothetical protein
VLIDVDVEREQPCGHEQARHLLADAARQIRDCVREVIDRPPLLPRHSQLQPDERDEHRNCQGDVVRTFHSELKSYVRAWMVQIRAARTGIRQAGDRHGPVP